MSNTLRAAIAAAFLLVGCGGGGGDAAPPSAAITPAQALLTSAQTVMDLTELVWALSFDVQSQVVSAPGATIADSDCLQGGRMRVTRPTTSLLRIDSLNCTNGGITFNGVTEVESAVVTVVTDGVDWAGTVRWTDRSVASGGGTSSISATAVGSGFVESTFGTSTRGQPMILQLSALTATRTPDALGRGATLTSPLLRVERIPVLGGPSRDLYAIDGCLTFAATGLSAELCIDAGSRIALLENIGTEQLTGRLRWNPGTAAGFEARLRATPAGPLGSTALRIELDLDNNGSFETSATLDRVTDIGLRL